MPLLGCTTGEDLALASGLVMVGVIFGAMLGGILASRRGLCHTATADND